MSWKPVRHGNIPFTVYEKKSNVWGWIIGIGILLALIGAATNDNNPPNGATTTPVQYQQAR